MNIIFRLFVIVFIVGTALVVTGESKTDVNTVEKEKSWNKKVSKIMTDEKYLGNRFNSIVEIIGYGATFTTKDVNSAFKKWLRSVQQLDGGLSLIHFTPDMLSEENKDKFNKAILGINREDIVDKLNALNVVIDHSPEKITGAFGGLINPQFGMYAKSDMSIYWLEYFLSKKNVDINNWKKHTPMEGAINAINYKVAELLILHGYKPNAKDFEFIQGKIVEVKEDDIGQYNKESTIEAIHKIETLLRGTIHAADKCTCPSDYGQSKKPVHQIHPDKKQGIMICNLEREMGEIPSKSETYLPMDFGVYRCGEKKPLLIFDNVHEECCSLKKDETSFTLTDIVSTIPSDDKFPLKISYTIYYPNGAIPAVKAELINEDKITKEMLSQPLVGEVPNDSNKLGVFIKALQCDVKTNKYENRTRLAQRTNVHPTKHFWPPIK